MLQTWSSVSSKAFDTGESSKLPLPTARRSSTSSLVTFLATMETSLFTSVLMKYTMSSFVLSSLLVCVASFDRSFETDG